MTLATGKVGDVYTSPWGRYAIWSLVPFVLISLDVSGAWVESEPNILMRVTGEVTSVPRFMPRIFSLNVLGESVQSTEVSPAVPPPSPLPAPAYIWDDTLTLGGMRPGNLLCVLPGKQQMWWRPCLTRTEYGGKEHCWFIASTDDHSMFCWECRKSKPTYVWVPKPSHLDAPHPVAATTKHVSVASSPSPESSGAGSSPVSSVSAASQTTPPLHGNSLVQGSLTPATPTSASPQAAPTRVSPALIPQRPQEPTTRPEYRPSTVEAWKEEISERAAIMEYCGGYSRSQSEHLARVHVGPQPKPLAFTKGGGFVPDGEQYW